MKIYPESVIVAEVVQVTDDRFHDGLARRIVRDVSQADDVSELMQHNAVKIDCSRLEWPTIGIKSEGRIHDNIGLGVVAGITGLGQDHGDG
jgi:hypothetical protein